MRIKPETVMDKEKQCNRTDEVDILILQQMTTSLKLQRPKIVRNVERQDQQAKGCELKLGCDDHSRGSIAGSEREEASG